jgi:uncharacterized protein YrzB (UPF0473 family)
MFNVSIQQGLSTSFFEYTFDEPLTAPFKSINTGRENERKARIWLYSRLNYFENIDLGSNYVGSFISEDGDVSHHYLVMTFDHEQFTKDKVVLMIAEETESAEYECGFMYMDDIENEVTIAIEGVSYPEALDAFCFESEGVIEADTFEEFLMDPDFAEIVATHKLLTY